MSRGDGNSFIKYEAHLFITQASPSFCSLLIRELIGASIKYSETEIYARAAEKKPRGKRRGVDAPGRAKLAHLEPLARKERFARAQPAPHALARGSLGSPPPTED